MRVLLVVYDNQSNTHWFPLGMAYIAAVLQEAGHEVEIYSQDFHHYPEEHLTAYLDEHVFDVVGYGTIGGYYQHAKLKKDAAAINASKNRPFFMLGGHGPSPEPEYFMDISGADAVVIGEGELTTVELLEALESGGSLAGVKGLAYRDEAGAVQVNPRREVIEDIDALPYPAWDLFPMHYYRSKRLPNCEPSDHIMPVLSARGCKFKCNFCYRMDPGVRIRSNEAILAEIRELQERYAINYICFIDELLMVSEDRTMGLCESILSSGLKFKWWCNGRLNYAKRPVLEMMKKAGCVFINYGIESMDDVALSNMGKALTTDMVYRGVEATLDVGISPGLNIIFGNIGETRETLNAGVEFLLKYLDGSQMRTIRPVTPYPGSALYYHALNTGKLKDVREFYEEKHTNSDLVSINFTNGMTDAEIHEALLEANRKLITSYYEKLIKNNIESMEQLYLEEDSTFRGFRHR